MGGKRPPSGIAHPPQKKQKMGILRDVSMTEAGKYGTLNEFAFFDKVRKALRNPEVYNNFLRCLILFNQEIISRYVTNYLIIKLILYENDVQFYLPTLSDFIMKHILSDYHFIKLNPFNIQSSIFSKQ